MRYADKQDIMPAASTLQIPFAADIIPYILLRPQPFSLKSRSFSPRPFQL